MAMEQIGYVTQIDDHEVKIRVMRESACGGNCGACHGCPSGAILVTYPNDPEHLFFVGETVVIEMPTGKFLGGTLRSYGVMTLAMILGAILGYFLTHTELGSVFGTMIGFVVGVLFMRWLVHRQVNMICVKRQRR